MNRLAAALGAALVAGAAQASTVTIDFDELADPDQPSAGQVGNVHYEDLNRFLYGNLSPFLVLGDDGFVNATFFTADPGTTFTPVSLDLTGGTNLVRAPCPGCTPAEIQQLADDCGYYGDCTGFTDYDDYDYFSFIGYRNGSVVATAGAGSGIPFYDGTFTFGSEFAGIDRLGVMLTPFPPGGVSGADGYAYACGDSFFAYCLFGTADNFTVSVAVVPLGASLPPFLLALAGLGWVARRRRGA